MKNINYVINGVLAVAVVILFVMQFSGKKEVSTSHSFTVGEDSTSTSLLPIAYVNVDSLLENYNFSKELNERVVKRQEDARLNITQKYRSLQSEMQDFQRKAENNAFLTRERMEQERQRLLVKQQELEDLDKKLSQELMTEQMKMNEQLRDTVVSQLKMFNKNKGYQIIFGKMSDNILYAENAYDVTAELIDFLNKNYSPSSANK